MVYQKLKSQDFKARAIYKLGIDPSQCNLVAPIPLTSFCYEDGIYDYAYVKNNEIVTNVFSLTWLFFGTDCIYSYNYKFDMTSDTTIEETNEIHYKDIDRVEAWQTNEEKMYRDSLLQRGCIFVAPDKVIRQYDYFRLHVHGHDVSYGMKNNPNLENAIMGAKQLIRDKKLST